MRQRTGLLLDPYFSATKIALAARPRAGRARARRARRARLRHDRQLPALAADGRRACTRPTSRTLRARCCSTFTAATGTTICCALFGVPRACCPRCKDSSARFRRDRTRTCSARHPDRRHRGRPAGGADRPGLLRARHGEVHLRHRLLHAAQHRRDAGASREPAADDAGLSHRRHARPMRWRARSSSPGPPSMAARRARADQRRGGDRRARHARARQPRRLHGPRLRRPRRAALGAGRAGR